jgi:stage V sporulation protein R
MSKQSRHDDLIFTDGYTVRDLEVWNEKILKKVEEFGLSCFPQDFEICDYDQMLGYITYSGMPSHYPHWSYGKAFERQKMLYNLGMTGLPYEMVINSDPCLAYLMRDNTLALQILTMAHVYAHNDFFKNNGYFADTNPQATIDKFKTRAERVREYIEDPSIGIQKVERLLDAAHALQFQVDPNRMIRRLSRKERQERVFQQSLPPDDPHWNIHKPQEYTPPDLDKIPLEPERDLLIFIRDYHNGLAEWEKDLLTIVHDEAEYFLPQMETKIMNEGWASFWHHRIMLALDLPDNIKMEFFVRHNQVLRPITGSLNPYHLGFKIFESIFNRYEEPDSDDPRAEGLPGGQGAEKIFQIRETDRDVSFLRTYLTEELARELDLFVHEERGRDRVITDVSDEPGFENVKRELLRTIGSARTPVIHILDADLGGSRLLHLEHVFEGRELKEDYAKKTLEHLGTLWGGRVCLDTRIRNQDVRLTYNDGEVTLAQLPAEQAS